MALKAGGRGFLHLSAESFAERTWREAVIVSVDGEWVKTLVRCTQEELGASQLSALEHGGAHYCLVEAKDHQLWLGVQETKMLLEADPKVLVAAAKQMLDSTDEELNYATASDPGRRKTAKARAKPKKRVTENSESSSGGSSSQAAKDTDPMLAQLRKSWLGSGMQKESRKEKTRSSSKRRGQRFSLLSKKKEDSEDEPDSKLDATTSLIEAAVKADWPCSLHRSPSLGRRRARSPEAVEKATRRIPVGVHHRQRPTWTAVLRKGIRQSCERVPCFRKEDVQASTPLHQAVCETGGKGAGSGGPSSQIDGPQPPDPLWQAAEPQTLPLPLWDHPRPHPEGGVRPGRAPICPEPSSCPSGGTRRVVGCGLDGDTHRGAVQGKTVRRRSCQPPARDIILEKHERAGTQHGSAEEEGQWKGEPLPPTGQGQQEGKAAREGEGQADYRCLSRVRACVADGSSKGFPMHPIVQSLQAGRFLKLLSQSPFIIGRSGLGPRTPPPPKRGILCFRLHW